MPMVNLSNSTSMSSLARSMLHMAMRAMDENPNAMEANRLLVCCASSISDPLEDVCMCSSNSLRAASTLSRRSSGASDFPVSGVGLSSGGGVSSEYSLFIACIISQLSIWTILPGVIPARLVRDSMCRGFRANPLLSQGLVHVEMRADTLAGNCLHDYDDNVGRI